MYDMRERGLQDGFGLQAQLVRPGRPRAGPLGRRVYKDQDGGRHNKGFLTRKDAKAFLVLTEGEIVRGVHTPESTSVTVAKAAQLWLKRGELEKLERSTLRQYRTHAHQHILPLIGAVKLARLSTPVVQAFRDKLLETRSRALSRKVLASLKSIIGEVMRRGLVTQNAALPRHGRRQEARAGQAHRWRGRPVESGSEPFPRSCPGEMADVFREHDLHRHARVGVTRACLVGRRFRTTGHSCPATRRSLGHDRRSEIGRRQPHDPDGSSGFQYAEGITARLSEGTARSCLSQQPRQCREPCQHRRPRLRATATDLGEVKYGLHSLRHFFASWAIEHGFSAKRLQALLGQSSIQMTFGTYGHLFPSLEDDHAKFAAGELQITTAQAVEEAAE
jgi:integrase